MRKTLVDLSLIFNLENERNGNGRHFRNLSASTLPPQDGYTKDGTADPRLKIFNECGRLGKILCKPDGTQYSSNELFAMDLDELQALFARTPADPNLASAASDGNAAMTPKGVGDGSRPLVLMSALFERDSAIKLLSASGCFDSSPKGKEDAERLRILRKLEAEGKTIMKNAFDGYTAKELLEMPIATLRLVAPNCQAVTKVL